MIHHSPVIILFHTFINEFQKEETVKITKISPFATLEIMTCVVAKLTYINEAVMEMKPVEAGIDPGISKHGLQDDFSYDKGDIWASLVVKCRRELSIAQLPSDQNCRDQTSHYHQ